MTKRLKQIGLVLSLLLTSVLFSACNPLEKKSKAGLQVITDDVSSSIFLDGQYLDKTPFIDKEIKPGNYALTIDPDDPNLASYETSVSLRKGLLTVVTWKPGNRPETSGGVIYEMEALNNRRATEISFITIPDNAIVKLDQREQEFSPLVVSDLEEGHHQFEVSLPSYETQKHTINAVKGHRINITVKLAKLSGDPTNLVVSQASEPATESAQTATDSAQAATEISDIVNRRLGATSTGSAQIITGAKVTIKPTDFFQDGKEVLRVRDSAGAGGQELGFAPVGAEYAYQGQTTAGWYKIDFNGQAGWVSGQYATLEE